MQRDPRDERGDMVVGWLARIAVVLAIIAVIGFDVVTTFQGQVTARDQAGTAATAGYESYAANHNVQTAYQAALAAAKAADPADTIKPADFVVTQAGVVTLKLSRPVHTIVARYLPIPAAKMATANGTAQSST